MAVNETVLEQLQRDVELGVEDALSDYSDVGEDDIFHGIADSICFANYDQHPEEVHEFWRMNLGTKYPNVYERPIG